MIKKGLAVIFSLIIIYILIVITVFSIISTNKLISRSKSSSVRRISDRNIIEKYPLHTNLPTLYINLDNNASKTSITKNKYISGTYTLVVSENEYIHNRSLEIKGRGNYSWTFPKKPYTINLKVSTDLLGMGSAKKWVLIGNYSDKTLMRNYLTLNLAKEIGLEYTPECRYVDVVINGQYNGNYLLTEKIQIHESRVDINEISGGLFEIEAAFRHNYACSNCIQVPSGVHITYKDPDLEDIGSVQRAENLKKFKSFFTQLDLSLNKGYEKYSQYIDVDSFVDWYIVNEFVKNYDSAFVTSDYCYIAADGRLHMGPVWDFDTCMGNQDVATGLNPSGYHVINAPWFKTLMSDKIFKDKLSKRWTKLRKDGTFDSFLQKIRDTSILLEQSENLDHKLWKTALTNRDLRGRKSLFTYKEEVDYLYSWVEKRIQWLDSVWSNKNG